MLLKLQQKFFSVRVFLGNLMKKSIIIYVHITYRLRISPFDWILKKFPGNSGYRFDAHDTSNVRVKELVSEKFDFGIFKMPSSPILNGTSALIIQSRRALYKWNLQEMATGIRTTLKGLGADCCVSNIGNSETLHLLSSKHFDVLILDNEMLKEEIDLVLNEVVTLRETGFRIKLILICYDLWRDYDIHLIKHYFNFFDYFLHMDQKIVSQHLSAYSSKFYFWPIARFWHKCSRESTENLAGQATLFYSGSARQVDRRDILNCSLQHLKKTILKSDFYVCDPLVPSTFLSGDTYISKIKNSRVILSLSQKTSEHFILTGRAIESLVCGGGVVLQQENSFFEPLGSILTPNEHYLTFSNCEELGEQLQFISQNPSLGRDISLRAKNAMRSIFNDEYLSAPFVHN